MSFTINPQTQLSHDFLVKQLNENHYTRNHMVLEAGDFCVRGCIVDVFPEGAEFPLRIEFDDDVVDRLSEFQVQSQRSVKEINSPYTLSPFQKKNHDDSTFYEVVPIHDILSDIGEGDYVVHEDYGIGQFVGLKSLTVKGELREFIHIQYKGEDKLFVPIDQLQRIHRYSNLDITPQVSALHDGKWKKTRAKAKKEVIQMAQDIYLLYQKRIQSEGVKYDKDSDWQKEMEAAFPFKPTKDQRVAVKEIKQDMMTTKPMDRLVCGDVGYGKTEVIIRAVFKALEYGKQVIILVPTTILAEQHYKVFSERFKKYPFTIDVLSRFRSPKTQKEVIKNLKLTQLDLVIGTHRLLQADVKVPNLGFLVVDEEQRFGVKDKEKIKQLKHHIDVLSVTATPIPRTLYMSLTGARDVSLINTPPFQRKPIISTIALFEKEKVIVAISQEINRGGQVYYLFNRVEKIAYMHSLLTKWFPDLTILVAHGQMPHKSLQDHMMTFWAGKCDILLCTTIIESGLDVPKANTIIIDLADRLGLAQIHQIRGRVGRTATQGYAHLFYREESTLTEKAKKRLQAIKEYASLGSGYKLAMKDLEIRGAGTLLGHQQSGHVTAIGFDLYCKLVEATVKELKGEEAKEKSKLGFASLYIPEDYIFNTRERLSIYNEILEAEYIDQMDDIMEMLKDRYGPIPTLVKKLLTGLKKQLTLRRVFD